MTVEAFLPRCLDILGKMYNIFVRCTTSSAQSRPPHMLAIHSDRGGTLMAARSRRAAKVTALLLPLMSLEKCGRGRRGLWAICGGRPTVARASCLSCRRRTPIKRRALKHDPRLPAANSAL